MRCLDLEMLDVALLHLEQDRAGLLQDRGRQPVLLVLLRDAHGRVGRDQDGLVAARQEDPAVLAGADGSAWLQGHAVRERDQLQPLSGDRDIAG